jgi:hypothetical protein
VLAVSTGFDTQGSYRANSADIAATLPVNRGDEIAAQFQYTHDEGRTKFLTIPDQNDYRSKPATTSTRPKPSRS